ncbi:MAG: hypothetical protein KAT16_02960 [Candidatus Heimdallarchaeota archaeon]|nr:hypothetical protein [Candidatus Heimdallarchaeota archaeon]
MTRNFYRFWLVNEQGLYIFDQKLDKQKTVLTKAGEDRLIAELFNDLTLDVDSTDTAIFHREMPSFAFTRLYYQKYNRDLYILLADEMVDVTEVAVEFQPWREIRNKQRENLIGIIFSVFDDRLGPKVIYNSALNEETALMVAVQGQTISYMGKINEFILGFKQPLIVPNRDDLIHCAYDFLIPAPNSTDPRIAEVGRVTNIYLLFPKNLPYLKEEAFLQFIESSIEEWVYNFINFQKENEDDFPTILFDELLEDLRSTVNIAIDLATHEEREVRKLKDFVMELLTQNQVLTYQVRRLKERNAELEAIQANKK